MDQALIQLILRERGLALAITDRSLNILALEGSLDLFAQDQPPQPGSSLLESIPELAAHETALNQILAGQTPRLQIPWLNRRRPDGQPLYLTMLILPYHHPTGHLAGLLHLLQDITGIAHLKIETLLAQQLKAEHMERDLDIAAEVQASFLPKRLPEAPNYDFAAALISASKIGGDFYDIIQTDQGHLNFVIADVAGKGISAALLAASLRATLRAELQHLSPTPNDQSPNLPISQSPISNLQPPNSPNSQTHQTQAGRTLCSVNAKLYQDLSRIERFATVALAQLTHLPPPSQTQPSPSRSQTEFGNENAAHRWHYANAGHTTAFWVRAEPLRLEPLPSMTVPLGVLPEIEEINLTIELQPNDILLLYTDGLTEVENAAGKILGRAGVIDVLLATHTAPAQFIVDSLIEANRLHRGDASPTLDDDLTLLIIKRVSDDAPTPRYLKRLHWPSELGILPAIEVELERLKPYLPSTGQAAWLIQVQLATTEAVSNIIRHAYTGSVGGIHGLIALYTEHLSIDLFDVGQPYEPQQETALLDFDPADPPEGGYGLSIMRQVMDNVTYQRVHDGYHERGYNHWRLTRRLPE